LIRGKNTGQQGAEYAAHTVHGEHIEGIVNLEFLLDGLGRHIADYTGAKADHQGAAGANKTGSGGNGAQPRHHTGNDTQY